MERQQIFDKVEEIWWECQDRNIGSNEAELDFRETVTDWIQEQIKNLSLFSVMENKKWTDADLRTSFEDGCKFLHFKDLQEFLLERRQLTIPDVIDVVCCENCLHFYPDTKTCDKTCIEYDKFKQKT
jgi:hypothetical protein